MKPASDTVEHPVNIQKLAHDLGISTQSVELRIRRLINKPENNDVSIAGRLDHAEARLLGLLDLSEKQRHRVMIELGMPE
jgi:hypothetical protein